MMKKTTYKILLAAVALMCTASGAQAQQSYYVAKRVNGGTAIIEVRPGLAQKVLALPRRTFNTVVGLTEPPPSAFGGTIKQKDMAYGSTSKATLVERTGNLVKNTSVVGGNVVNSGVSTTRKVLSALNPY